MSRLAGGPVRPLGTRAVGRLEAAWRIAVWQPEGLPSSTRQVGRCCGSWPALWREAADPDPVGTTTSPPASASRGHAGSNVLFHATMGNVAVLDDAWSSTGSERSGGRSGRCTKWLDARDRLQAGPSDATP